MTTQVHPNGTATAATFSEAPASINVRVCSPAGFEYQLTMRAARVGDVLNQAQELEKWLLGHDWRPATFGKPAPSAQAQGDAPLCPAHGKPMKQGKGGGWYCPVKLLEDDGTGKPVYCKQRK